MELKEGYKKTEVGIVPQDWLVKKLGEVSSMKSGKSITAKHIDENALYPCYGGNGLRGYTTTYTHDGDFALIGRQGALCGNVQYVSGKYFASEHAIVVTPHLVTDIRWLYFVLTTMNLNRYSESSAQPGLSVFKLLNLAIPLPPTKLEQTAIASALSDADALIASLEKLIAKKRNIKQGAMQELLTGKKRLPGFSGKWEVKKLGEVGECIRGVSYNPERDLIPYDGADTIRLLRSNNIQESSLELSDVQFVHVRRVKPIQALQDGDIVICMANGSKRLVGKAAYYEATLDIYRYTFGAFMGCFRTNPTKASEKFVFYCFQSFGYKYNIEILLSGSSINNLSPSHVESIEVPYPDPVEQIAIAKILSDMDSEIASLESKLDKYKMLKQGMMQNLLTGKIRLN